MILNNDDYDFRMKCEVDILVEKIIVILEVKLCV